MHMSPFGFLGRGAIISAMRNASPSHPIPTGENEWVDSVELMWA